MKQSSTEHRGCAKPWVGAAAYTMTSKMLPLPTRSHSPQVTQTPQAWRWDKQPRSPTALPCCAFAQNPSHPRLGASVGER